MGTSQLTLTLAALTLALTACSDGGLTALKTSAESAASATLSSSSTALVGNIDDTTPLYRQYNNNMHESNPPVNQFIATTAEGILGGVFVNPSPTRVRLMGCFIFDANDAQHPFSSTDSGCEGQRVLSYRERMPVYLETQKTPVAGRALYRCYQPVTGDHMDSTNAGECTNNAYFIEGILGYLQ